MSFNPPITAATRVIAASTSNNPERADIQCNGIADQSKINTALALGDTYLLDGIYNTSAKIEVPENTALILSAGAEIRPDSSFDVVELHSSNSIGILGGSIQGGRINVRPLGDGNFTDCAILIDDTLGGNQHMYLSDTNLLAYQGEGNGTGLALKAATGTYITALTTRDMFILGFEKGISLSATGTGWINGNHFLNIYTKGCRYAMHLERETGEMSGNTFDNFHYQATTNSERVIYCEGNTNYFRGVFWDWEAYALSMDFAEFTSTSSRNQLFYNGIAHGDIVTVKNDGVMNYVIRTDYPYTGHSLTVARFGGDYRELSTAIAALSGKVTNYQRGRVTVVGANYETNQIVGVDYVDVIGKNNANIRSQGLNADAIVMDGITSARWSNIHFQQAGYSGTASKAVMLIRNAEKDVIFKNCRFEHLHTGTATQAGVNVSDYTKAHFINCIAKGADTGTAAGAGWYFPSGKIATPILTGCIGYGSKIGAPGFLFSFAAAPQLNDCTAIPGNAANSAGFKLEHNTSPILNNCHAELDHHATLWSYNSANSGRFQPFSGDPYQLYSITINVINPLAAGTLDIGTTIGGTQIASGINISSAGYKFFGITQAEVTSGNYIYATPSAAISNGDIAIYYDVIYNHAGNHALYLNTQGHAKINGGKFIVNGASDSVYIALNVLNWELNNATLETLDRANQYSINAYAALSNVPIMNSALIGPTNNITSYIGSTVGTNALRP